MPNAVIVPQRKQTHTAPRENQSGAQSLAVRPNFDAAARIEHRTVAQRTLNRFTIGPPPLPVATRSPMLTTPYMNSSPSFINTLTRPRAGINISMPAKGSLSGFQKRSRYSFLSLFAKWTLPIHGSTSTLLRGLGSCLRMVMVLDRGKVVSFALAAPVVATVILLSKLTAFRGAGKTIAVPLSCFPCAGQELSLGPGAILQARI